MPVCKICGQPVTAGPVYHAERLEKSGGWISVKDRLPDESLLGQEVVVCIRVRRPPFLRVTTAAWWGGDLRNDKNVWRSVAYWMPLPEPPREEA